MKTLTDRQQQLLVWLKSLHSLSLTEIQEHFSISIATAYRDVRALEEAGLVHKTFEGVKLVRASEAQSNEHCAFCGGEINLRASFVIQMQDGSKLTACCPHCGILALGLPGMTSALATDFLYGRRVNARQASFLLESTVSLCCEPSVLCFSTQEEVLRFQKGFGGEVCNLEEARARLTSMMALDQTNSGI